MVDLADLEVFLNEKSCAENDIVEILGAGVIEQKEDANTHRKYRVLKIEVRCNNKELIFAPNGDATEILQKAWGRNTDSWKGHKFSVKFYPKTSFGVTKTAILPQIIQ